ncbi:unnamed protein product [Cylicostephanus goldi]|uniref:DDE Tnp4 domain-containing protein n=1 Tax=Cylicostephanus goldi TaxID=71465 RepID=A0A3P7NA42_CYLGO|nr:unnamed protein product [Cylicostephanus goldi]
MSSRIFRKYQLPNITGIIDGTHIKITAPKQSPMDYVNRKQYHSLNVGAICDDRMLFRWINASWPGHARAKIEQAFEILKRQWLILHGECRYDPETATKIVIACTVLRNIANSRNEPTVFEESPPETDEQDMHEINEEDPSASGRALIKRVIQESF